MSSRSRKLAVIAATPVVALTLLWVVHVEHLLLVANAVAALSLLALALATLILTAVGVFVDVAVITVAPIALAIARRADLSKAAILLAMIGGGKAGNVMSPNPNAIAAADAFHLPLTSVMAAGIIADLGKAMMQLLALLRGHVRRAGAEACGDLVDDLLLGALADDDDLFELGLGGGLGGLAAGPPAGLVCAGGGQRGGAPL